ncbi:hypothetical protein BDZ89DRAFT_747332 [Hymenopellis radicata]|nr:hypothetical protein BDZ89DRAFT_747332 [Hymenopellis radicata]
MLSLDQCYPNPPEPLLDMEDMFIDARPPISLGSYLVKTIGDEPSPRRFPLVTAMRGPDMRQQVALRALAMLRSTIQRRYSQETELSSTTCWLWAKDVHVYRELLVKLIHRMTLLDFWVIAFLLAQAPVSHPVRRYDVRIRGDCRELRRCDERVHGWHLERFRSELSC